jgi:DNA-binding LacI/PurR family transcriptional regulator
MNDKSRPVLLAAMHPMHSAITVTRTTHNVAYNMIQYLYDAGKRRIAFFGVNPSSPHDNMRLEAYYQAIRNLDIACTEQDIYFTKGDISQCASVFQQQIRTYDAVWEQTIFMRSLP